MNHKLRRYDSRSFVMNIDSCCDGVLAGRFYHPYQGESGQFQDLMQFLLRADQIMDETDTPQSFHVIRTFFPSYLLDKDTAETGFSWAGKIATFSLHIMFRRNASWQGNIMWMETGQSQNFRSVLELIWLINSVVVSKQMSLYFAHPEAGEMEKAE